jgi:LCP family protein required for cell wall assembly
MPEKRVDEYALELGLEVDELIERLQKYGLAVEDASSLVSEEDLKPLRPELYQHTGGSLTVDELAEKLGFPSEFIEESVRALQGDPQGVFDQLDPETIQALTGSKESLRVKELGRRLGLSSRKTLKLLNRLGRPALHNRSRVDPVTVNVLSALRLGGIKEYLGDKKKTRSKGGVSQKSSGSYSSTFGFAFIITSCICFLLTVGYVAYGFYGLSRMSQPARMSLAHKDENSSSHKSLQKIKSSRPMNLLILGVEATDWVHKGRSDTIMVARIDPARNQVTIVSIPRDSRVPMGKYGQQKLTHAYFFGRAPLVQETITKNFGIPIDRCVEVHFEGFYEIVDYLGGVDLDVEKPIHSPKFWNFRPFIIPAGKQHLSPKEALAYVHFRFDKMGDIGRIERQQKFVRAVAKQIRQSNNLVELPIMINQLASHLRTNMSITEMLFWGKILWRVNLEEVETEMVPGTPKMIYDKDAGKKLSFWIVDHDKAAPLISRVFDIPPYQEEEEPESQKSDTKNGDTQSLSSSQSSKQYTVKTGDALSSIADRFGVEVSDLLKANPKISDVGRIQAGDVLTIPLDKSSNKENHSLDEQSN